VLLNYPYLLTCLRTRAYFPFSNLGSLFLMFDPATLLDTLEMELRAILDTTVTTFVATARTRLEGAVAEVAKDRAKALAEVDVRRGELGREVEAMHKHKEAQEGRVELNIGGYRFETSVQALRRVPHTFFDAYFSGRYAQDVCRDGSIFVDRDGEHFGHVLEYMRDGYVSVADPSARPSMSLLRALKREFGFYCIELCMEPVAEPEQPVVAFVIGGKLNYGDMVPSTERYDASLGQWSQVAAMGEARSSFAACVLAGELYVCGGTDTEDETSVEKYSPSSDTWSAVAPIPEERAGYVAVAVGSAMYLLGGVKDVHKFDSTQGTWSEVTTMPEGRTGIAACSVESDIYVFGGEDDDDESSRTVFKYDTEDNEWSTLAPMPDDCYGHMACVLDGQVYIVGAGISGREVLRFDPAADSWSTLAPTRFQKENCASFVLEGCLRVARRTGGSSVERYDVASNTWTAWGDMFASPMGRTGFSVLTIGSTGTVEKPEENLFDSLIAKAAARTQGTPVGSAY
jgi:hypothetical protein